MKKSLKQILAVFLACAGLFTGSASAEFKPEIDLSNGEVMYSFFDTLLGYTEKYYRFGVTREALLEAAVKEVLQAHPELFDTLAGGAYSVLDENSRYLTLEEYVGRAEDILGEFAGIGIYVSEYDGLAIVGAPIDGTPAQRAGLLTGDIIVSVDGKDITGFVLDQTISLIRGEAGTWVELGMRRGSQLFTVRIQRDIVKINPVSYRPLEKNNAGYVRISTFNANTSEYLADALEALASQGVDKIVLDLRDNLGGLLWEAVKTASYFLPDNTLVVTEDFSDSKHNVSHYSLATPNKFKAVVLVNEYSASASEIVAAAIADNKQGPLVGVRSFGKGTVQQSTQMKNGGAMWLTIAKYLTPSGAYIHEAGIDPENWVKNRELPLDNSSFAPILGHRVLQVGDTGADVLAVNQRLSALRYLTEEPGEEFTYQTELAVSMFQSMEELFSYGVADLTTQVRLMEAAIQAKVVQDDQMEKALELVYNLN